MSTNYYAVFENEEVVKKYFLEEYEEITENGVKKYEVHIGKRSYGWKPLFEAHLKAYDSVERMIEFFSSHKCTIYSEYDEKLTLDELKTELIDWNKDTTPHKEFYSDAVGQVTVPIDNVIFAQKTTDPVEINWKNQFFNDKDGYNFLIGDFS